MPIEVLELIFSDIPQPSLPSVLLVNSLFYAISIRVLYRTLLEIPPKRTIALLNALVNNPSRYNSKKPSSFAHTFHLDFSQHRITSNFLRLLRKALQSTPSLKDLSLEFSLHDNHFSLAWCLEDSPFQLSIFTASLRCDPQLASFLESQSSLRELCLRGFQTTSPFILSPRSLPNLSAFRAVHAGPPVLETVIRGRPVEGVSLSLFSEDGFAPLDTLSLSQKQIKRLTIMSLDNTSPEVLLPEVAARLPKLEALHIVVLMAQYSHVRPLALGCPFFGLMRCRTDACYSSYSHHHPISSRNGAIFPIFIRFYLTYRRRSWPRHPSSHRSHVSATSRS